MILGVFASFAALIERLRELDGRETIEKTEARAAGTSKSTAAIARGSGGHQRSLPARR